MFYIMIHERKAHRYQKKMCLCVYVFFVLGHVFFPGWQLEADSYKDMLCLSQQSSQKQHQQKQMNHKKTEEEESKQTEQK